MAKAGRESAGTPALRALLAAGVAHTVREYAHDPSVTSYGLEAAEALGVDPDRVYKTLMVRVDSGLAVGIVPVTRSLDLKAIALALGAKKATMADPAQAQRSSGYVLGGISPFGQKRPVPTVLDESAIGHETILVSGGRRGLDVELAPQDLCRLVQAGTAAIAR